jgi:arylsulfatase A-like enzyme
VLDFGTPAVDGRVDEVSDDPSRPPTIERGATTWSIVAKNALRTSFVTAEAAPVLFGASVRSLSARRLTIAIDGHTIGSARLEPGRTKLVELPPTTLPLDPGEHTLELFFAPRSTRGPVAEVDWVRIGRPDELKQTYGPATLDDVVDPRAVIGKVPHRAFSLRAPGLVRCPVRVPSQGRLRVAVGARGTGRGDVEIALRQDGAPEQVLTRRTLEPSDDPRWLDLDVPLDAYADQLVHLELRAPSGTEGARFLFGDPEIVVPTIVPQPAPPAKVVVLVVLAGVDRQTLPGYGPTPIGQLDRLAALSTTGTTFLAHRGPTTVVSGTMASLLTGLPPAVHTLSDDGGRLPDTVPVLPQSAQEAGVQTAFFTAVPHSFAPFGLSRGAAHLEVFSPVRGDGEEPLSSAARWITEALATQPASRLFVVVHARGGHPPWNVAAKQLDSLPPENYSGEISPRRAAQQLATFRRRGKTLDLSQNDLVRIAALHQLALVEQDRALGELVDALAAGGVEDETMLVVTGDVSSGVADLFDDAPELDDGALSLPLWIRFPKGAHAGVKVSRATEVVDIARTVAQALSLEPPRGTPGRDLGAVASGLVVDADRPLVARAGDAWSVRWGDLVLRQRLGGRAKLCDLAVDESCAFDRRESSPFAASALLRRLARHRFTAATPLAPREAAVVDDDTLAALKVWGAAE